MVNESSRATSWWWIFDEKEFLAFPRGTTTQQKSLYEKYPRQNKFPGRHWGYKNITSVWCFLLQLNQSLEKQHFLGKKQENLPYLTTLCISFPAH